MPYEPIYDQSNQDRSFALSSPVIVWGVVMSVALGGAFTVVWRAQPGAERVIAAGSDAEAMDRLGADVRSLISQRDDLAQRLAQLERGMGELKVAARVAAIAPETTGSVARLDTAPPRPGQFAILLGPESTMDAARRRWSALVAKYPAALSRLIPRVNRATSGRQSFELRAGPFGAAVEADRVCALLAADGVPCDTADYIGETIERS